MPRLISVNVGTPRALGLINGKKVRSAIAKQPVLVEVYVKRLNIDGDRQADLRVHGGVNKAVYVYPSENYAYWKIEFPKEKLPWGSFGENLTTEGLSEDSIRVGDRLIISTVEFEVSQPRMPCYKLGLKFGTQSILKTFLDSRRSGFYVRVLKEGRLKSGDPIQLISGNNNKNSTIREIVESSIE